MQREPTCSLCGGSLKRESKVAINCGLPLCFDLASVCTGCSTAYPIAVGIRHLFTTSEPLYENGKRVGDK
jgi:hypothetical protein